MFWDLRFSISRSSLYIPIFFLVIFSFNDHIIPSLPFRGFTLQWYRELSYDFVMHDALYNSLFIAFCTTLISTTLGTLAAFPLVRRSYRLKGASQLLVLLPMIIPHFLMGVALLIFFSFIGVPLSRVTIILGHVVFTMPFAIMIVSARLHGFGRRTAGSVWVRNASSPSHEGLHLRTSPSPSGGRIGRAHRAA